MTEELYNKIDKFCNKTDWSKYLTYEHALEEFIKEIVEEETKQLEKENAELKKQLEMSNKVYNDNLDYSHHIEGQLTKAKEIIEKLRALYLSPVVTKEDIKRQDEILNEVEQFLNSEVEK